MATNYGLMKSKYTTLALEGQNKIIFISDYNLIIFPHVQEISDMYHKLYTQLCVHIICVCVCAPGGASTVGHHMVATQCQFQPSLDDLAQMR